ncbi:hypothetical protein HQ865_01240 [Mucilaginibacter mali]|uniref:Zona occludens toxin N-terminal domain-containing protein n=1 Tax=Mucilaginibacter mali TaxID=2740462 RepID=A0A7D4UBS0_9SPHI|nr:hypothetical protein [Mucilaginibacter mali]QKJ28439.1 hypothetical protein HQ865_01240 [Mucilaginibacter mali]
MSGTREHMALLVAGRKHTGKSTKLADVAKSYDANKKVLIIDVNGSPAYSAIHEIAVNDIPRWTKPGKAKIYGTPTKDTLNLVSKHFRNGLVIFEDCTKYIPAIPPPEIKSFLVDHRMHGCDLIFTFHSFRSVPPFFWTMVSGILVLKTLETFESRRNRDLVPNYEGVLAAVKRVNAHKDDYHSEYVATYI